MQVHPHAHVFHPYPELFEPELASQPYEIRDSRAEELPTSGMVDLRSRVIWVPLEPGGRSVTRHESGHVKWSPLRPARVRFDPRVLMVIEDARVNLGLDAVGIPVVLDDEAHAHVLYLLAQDAKRGDGFALFARGVASVGTSVEVPLWEQLLSTPHPLGGHAAAWMARARRELEAARGTAEVAPYRRGVALARALARELRALGLLDEKLQARTRVARGCCVWHPPGEGLLEPPHPHRHRHARPGHDERAAVEPGRMHVRQARLSVALRPGRGGRSWRAAAEGSVVRYLPRWPVDRAVFRRRARRGGGTLLVDTSGSMSLDVADLDRLLLATPHGMRVALYSGSGDQGELRIVADGARRAPAEQLRRFGNGNIVDLPALEWLARQPLPRLWLSDGSVTGVGDRGSQSLKDRCKALCERARIRRVAKLEEVTALVSGR